MVNPNPQNDESNDSEKTASDPQLEETRVFSDADAVQGPSSTFMDLTLRADPDSDSSPSASTSKVRYFGSYELLSEIARGGMGVVYKARQTTLNRIVAVKMILAGQLASDDQVRRFLIEAEAAANLDHPGIVPVFEFGKYEDTHYFSMGFVDGPSLADEVADNPLDPDEAANLLRKVVDAVAYAHGHGVIHRDLKPANILLEQGVEPRITDFGLAKKIDDDSELTKTGAIMGSVYYMPPEQATGKIEDIGPTADIYALGAILYKLLTGRPPFQAATVVETIRQVVGHEPVPPRRLNPRIPKDLETICLKCLEKEPIRRYNSANELSNDLQRFQEGLPIEARPISRVAHVWRWCRRNKLPATLSAVLAVALLAGVFAATTFWNKAQSEYLRAQDQQQMVHVLSNLVLKKTLDETVERLNPFFKPVEQQLQIVRSWDEEGVLDTDRPNDLNRLLLPLIDHYPQTSSIMVADDRGREHMLLRVDQHESDSETSTRRWRCRLTRRDEWGDGVKSIQWHDDDTQPQSYESEQLDYDPRLRPWYQGAVGQADGVKRSSTNRQEADEMYWTDPYVFFTTKELGITASVCISPGNETQHRVVASDVLLEDITRFTANKRPTPNGNVLVLTDKQKLIGLPNVPQFQSPQEWKNAFLKKPSELGLTVITDAAAQFSFSETESSQVGRFDSGGQSWWAGVRPFRLGANQVFWILVVVPESDLLYDLTTSDTTLIQE